VLLCIAARVAPAVSLVTGRNGHYLLHLPLCQRLHSNISLNQNFMTTPALVLGCVLSHREPLTNTSHCRVHSFCPKDAGYMVWTFSVSCFRVTKAD